MNRRLLCCLLPILALVATGGCGSAKKSASASTAQTGSSTATTPETTTTATTPAGPCKKVPLPKPKGAGHLKKPTLTLDPSKRWTATVNTNCGSFTIALDVKRAPKTTASFASLVRLGFYDKLIFHRIAPGFVIQGGDPLGQGTGGPGYRVVEAPPRRLQYKHGIVAMAKAGNEPAGTSGSQFFVMLADGGLPPEYALVGKVKKGLDVVDAIGTLPLQSSDPSGAPPVDPVVMTSVTIHDS